jgi:hypothetical protein
VLWCGIYMQNPNRDDCCSEMSEHVCHVQGENFQGYHQNNQRIYWVEFFVICRIWSSCAGCSPESSINHCLCTRERDDSRKPAAVVNYVISIGVGLRWKENINKISSADLYIYITWYICMIAFSYPKTLLSCKRVDLRISRYLKLINVHVVS